MSINHKMVEDDKNPNVQILKNFYIILYFHSYYYYYSNFITNE
jgi:hypothetical protein